MHRTNIYLDPEQCEQLDRLAAEEGATRAAVIRRLLDRALASHDGGVDRDLAAIEASFGVLTDLDAGERAPDGRGEHLDRMWNLGR